MASSINTIDLDVDTIDVSEYPVPHYGDKPRADAYDKTLCQDNKDFTNFLNRCLMLEQSFEMEKIIGKILLPAYVCADDEYKKSEKFTKVIKKALQRLIDEPRKKYSHISDITDTLKFHVKKLPKKRVDFVTLSTNSVLGKTNRKNRKIILDSQNAKKSKKPKLDVIAVESEDDDDLIPVDDTESNTVGDDLMVVDDTGKVTVKNDLITVGDSAKKIYDDNLVAAHDIAKKLFGEVAGYSKVNNMEVDCGLIDVDQNTNETKVVNKVATIKPKKTNNSDTKIKNKKDKLKLKKSKYKPAITFESDDESYKKILVKMKDNNSKDNAAPNGTLQIENISNNNMPIEILDSQNINLQEEMQFYNNERNTVVNVDTNKFEHNKDTHHDKENLDKNENLCDSNNKLLVPRMEIILEEEKTPKKLDDTKRFERIKGIETEILKYKKKIADLELAEVTEDSSVSAYIRCDRLQAHIVKLYKELCSLNDAEPVKGRKVRLKHVAEGLPQGPVLRLEKFLNKQADEDGVAPFPDYADVVRCVEKSNLKDGLGWSKAKVHKEAQALFEYCGRALQKRRQRREWKDLRSQLSREEFEADPAASDPELAAKLELNRQLALKKEAEVLEKFSRMEATSDKVSVQHNDNKTQNRDSDSSSNDKLEQVELENPYIKPESGPKYQIKEDIGEPVIRIKEEPYEVPVYFALDHSIAIEISDSDSSEDSCVE
ncbi:uncharacterized protein isoform X1 [Choristoneura fumiferana]|uniref:uncharacterized protein isoform X1 n=1 Tax=Choristoneura fumiferana TaxID=7141 RepID=UPI003D15C967